MRTLFFTLCLLIAGFASGQECNKWLNFGFYNVENLFDTLDDPHTNDNEFLPENAKQWTGERYAKKITDLSASIKAMSSGNLPELIGVCEVENRKVTTDLSESVYGDNAGVIHKDSPDSRGIDVAAIYDKKKVTVNEVSYRRYMLPNHKRLSTRDILMADVTLKKSTRFRVIFTHWPSRRGGEEKSEPNRLEAARQVKLMIDSVRQTEPKANFIIMGDFNDEPTNKSLYEVLLADTLVMQDGYLFNLSAKKDREGLGTYNYRGNWNMLDQVIVSKNLVANGMITEESFEINRPEFILYTDKKGEQSPSRTYGGKNYYGGYSDHLPISLNFCKVK